MTQPPLCIETIRFDNGQFWNIEYHNDRLNSTRQALYQSHQKWDLAKLIVPPAHTKSGVFKCRVTYGEVLEKIEFEHYQPRHIARLKLIEANDLAYSFKYQNRQILNELFAQRGKADDILIIKNGFITDTSYANVAFLDSGKWLTPAMPLLAGTRRAQLLKEGLILEKQIRVQELSNFSRTRIFNAMIDFETATSLIE